MYPAYEQGNTYDDERDNNGFQHSSSSGTMRDTTFDFSHSSGVHSPQVLPSYDLHRQSDANHPISDSVTAIGSVTSATYNAQGFPHWSHNGYLDPRDLANNFPLSGNHSGNQISSMTADYMLPVGPGVLILPDAAIDTPDLNHMLSQFPADPPVIPQHIDDEPLHEASFHYGQQLAYLSVPSRLDPHRSAELSREDTAGEHLNESLYHEANGS